MQIVGNHSHRLKVAESYGFLRVTEETQQIFNDYFHRGFTPSAAKAYHEVNLMENCEIVDDIIKVLANAQTNPLASQVYGMHNKYRCVLYITCMPHFALHSIINLNREQNTFTIVILFFEIMLSTFVMPILT